MQWFCNCTKTYHIEFVNFAAMTKTLLFLFFISMSMTLSAQDWANLKRYQQDNKKVGLPRASENRVVFMGNSITEGWYT